MKAANCNFYLMHYKIAVNIIICVLNKAQRENMHVMSPGRQFLHISAYFCICAAILRGNE